MHAKNHNQLIALAGCIIALTCAKQNTRAADGHWVTTWGTAPQLTEPGNLPPVPLANSTVRQFVNSSIGGKLIRARFSNAYGTDSVNINAAHIALAPATASGGNGDIYPATDKVLTFRGAPRRRHSPRRSGGFCDPLEFDLPAITNVAISTYYGNISASTISGHPGSRSTLFIQAGNVLSAPSMPSASKTTHWYTIVGMDVLAAASSKTITILGDSITDGRGSTDNGNNRFDPDNLARRLITRKQLLTAGVGVVNMGDVGSGNGIFGGLGVAAQNRFDRDCLNQSGVRYFICFEGVNDIGSGSSSMTTATNLVNAYIQFANKAHARNILAYGATITPFGGNGYYTTLHEQERQFVNAWMRTNTVYDGLIDFDAAVRDPMTLTNFQAAFYPGTNANDWLHMNPLGYQAMADAIDLNLFTK